MLKNIGVKDAKPSAYAEYSLSRTFVDLKKQVKRNIFLTMTFFQCLSHNLFLTTFFSQRLSHIAFLTTSSLQHLSHNVFLTPLPLHLGPHNVVLTTSQYTRNFSVLFKYPKFFPRKYDIILSIKLKQRRWTFAIYNLSLTVISCETLGQRHHTKVPRTKF